MTGSYLSNKGFTVFYAVIFVVYGLMTIIDFINIDKVEMPALVLSLVLTVASAIGLIYPVCKALTWKIKTKKKYGVEEMEYEIYFGDLNARILNKTTGEENKIDYRLAISNKITRKKKYLFVKYSSKDFLIIKTSDFARPTDYEKVNGYFSRFTR